MPDLIAPMFSQAYPGLTLRFVSLSPGAAISYAESGAASALLVSAPSLEDQFVAQGFSFEGAGRAVFYSGGSAGLPVESFDAYQVNPAKFAGDPTVQINSNAATDFLNLLTSQSFQARLSSLHEPAADPPFVADAYPKLTVTGFRARIQGGRSITVSGTLVNPVPGTPPLAGASVRVDRVLRGGASCVHIANAKTNSTGAYRITFTPTNSGNYVVATNAVTEIEDSALTPPLKDVLQPDQTAFSKIAVQGAIRRLSARGFPGGLLVTGSVLPGSGHVLGSVQLLARSPNNGRFTKLAATPLQAGDHTFAIGVRHASGTLFVKARFEDPGAVLPATSAPIRVSVPARAKRIVAASSLKVDRGRFTLTGRIDPRRTSAATVQVLGLDAGRLFPGPRAAAGGAASFHVIATASVRAGVASFTVRGRLRPGRHWILVPRYTRGGRTGWSYGALTSVSVC